MEDRAEQHAAAPPLPTAHMAVAGGAAAPPPAVCGGSYRNPDECALDGGGGVPPILVALPFFLVFLLVFFLPTAVWTGVALVVAVVVCPSARHVLRHGSGSAAVGGWIDGDCRAQCRLPYCATLRGIKLHLLSAFLELIYFL